MWEVDRALKENTTFEQTGPHEWRASIKGLVRGSAVAANPWDCQMSLGQAVDFVLSQILRRTAPFAFDSDGATASLAPTVQKLLTTKAAKIAVPAVAKKRARPATPKLARNTRRPGRVK